MDSDETMVSEVYAAFILTGSDLDPDQITAQLGITPSRTWRTGDLVMERASIRHKNNGWSVKSDIPMSEDLEEHVEMVLQRLKPAWKSLRKLSTRYTALIDCVVYSHGGARPAIFFNKDVIKRISELNAEIDVDLLIFE